MHAPTRVAYTHCCTQQRGTFALKRLVVPRRDVTPGNAHVKRPGEVCMFWESGIISSIKSGRVPRGCAACTCSYALFDPRLGTRTPFSLSLHLSLSFSLSFSQRPSLDPPHPTFTTSPSVSLCHHIYLVPSLSLYVSYSFRLSPFLASIVWDGIEQVDNLRIMQKFILHPPSSLSTLLYFSNHFKSLPSPRISRCHLITTFSVSLFFSLPLSDSLWLSHSLSPHTHIFWPIILP